MCFLTKKTHIAYMKCIVEFSTRHDNSITRTCCNLLSRGIRICSRH